MGRMAQSIKREIYRPINATKVTHSRFMRLRNEINDRSGRLLTYDHLLRWALDTINERIEQMTDIELEEFAKKLESV